MAGLRGFRIVADPGLVAALLLRSPAGWEQKSWTVADTPATQLRIRASGSRPAVGSEEQRLACDWLAVAVKGLGVCDRIVVCDAD